jgi:hypothetical protein
MQWLNEFMDAFTCSGVLNPQVNVESYLDASHWVLSLRPVSVAQFTQTQSTVTIHIRSVHQPPYNGRFALSDPGLLVAIFTQLRVHGYITGINNWANLRARGFNVPD